MAAAAATQDTQHAPQTTGPSRISPPPAPATTQQAACTLAAPHTKIEMAELSRMSSSAPPAPPPPPLSDQAEKGSWTTTKAAADEGEEQRHKAEAKERIEGGGVAVILGLSTLWGCLSFFDHANHDNIVPFSACLLLATVTFISGNALLVVSINMLGLRPDQVSGGQYVAWKWLSVSCAVLSMLTLFSLMTLLPSWLYQYIGIAVAGVIAALLPVAGVHWYLGRHTGGNDELTRNNEEYREELEDISKIMFAITTSVCAALVVVIFKASEIISDATADAVEWATYLAMFFTYATALLGLFLMTVSKQEWRITAIRLANASLLCSLACTGLAAAFVVLRYCVIFAFGPWLITGIAIFFRLKHYYSAPGDGADDQIKAIKEHAKTATIIGFGAIMACLRTTIGAKDDSSSRQVVLFSGMFMVVLTSVFVSGLGIMLLAAAPRSARALLAPAAGVLTWSSVSLFGVMAAVYCAELQKM